MCVQCVMAAGTVVTGASGARAWLATRRWGWLTPRTLKRITVGLLALVLLASSLLIGGTGSPAAVEGAGASVLTVETPGERLRQDTDDRR